MGNCGKCCWKVLNSHECRAKYSSKWIEWNTHDSLLLWVRAYALVRQIYIYTHTHTHTHTHAHTHTHTHIYIYMYICVYIYIPFSNHTPHHSLTVAICNKAGAVHQLINSMPTTTPSSFLWSSLAEQSSTFLFTNMIERGRGMLIYESYIKTLILLQIEAFKYIIRLIQLWFILTSSSATEIKFVSPAVSAVWTGFNQFLESTSF